MAAAPTPQSILAANIRSRRAAEGLTQDDLAAAVRRWGLDTWVGATVAQIETGRRRMSVDELVVLAFVFQTPMEQLLDTDAPTVRIGARNQPRYILQMRSGYAKAAELLALGSEREDAALTQASEALGVSKQRVRSKAFELWRRGLVEERELRLAAVRGSGDDRVRRGNITRAMHEELAASLAQRRRAR